MGKMSVKNKELIKYMTSYFLGEAQKINKMYDKLFDFIKQLNLNDYEILFCETLQKVFEIVIIKIQGESNILKHW